MYTTIIVQICLEPTQDLLLVTYLFHWCLLNKFSPHQWIFGTEASCCNSNKRTDGCEGCCSYARDLKCMQICVAVYTGRFFFTPAPSSFLLQCTITYWKVLLFSSYQKQEWTLNAWAFQSYFTPQTHSRSEILKAVSMTQAFVLLYSTMLSHCTSNAKIRRKKLKIDSKHHKNYFLTRFLRIEK